MIAQTLEKSAAGDTSEASSLSEDEEPSFSTQPTSLQEIVHAALHIQADLKETPGHDAGWHGIDREHVTKIIPNSLFICLSVLFGGDLVLEDSVGLDLNLMTQLNSIALDTVYAASKHNKLTPKHIG